MKNIVEESADEFVLKIKHSTETHEVTDLLTNVLNFCYDKCNKIFLTPKPICISNLGDTFTQSYDIPLSEDFTLENNIQVENASNLKVVHKNKKVCYQVKHLVVLSSYIHGKVLNNKRYLGKQLVYDIGKSAAILDDALKVTYLFIFRSVVIVVEWRLNNTFTICNNGLSILIYKINGKPFEFIFWKLV